MKDGSFDFSQYDLSLRNVGVGLLRCVLATLIVVATAFSVWCLPQALTWLQAYLAVYGVVASVNAAWVVMLMQPALVFSGAIVVWTVDAVLQAWQQQPVVDCVREKLGVVPQNLDDAAEKKKRLLDHDGQQSKNRVQFVEDLDQSSRVYSPSEKLPLSGTNNSPLDASSVAGRGAPAQNDSWTFPYGDPDIDAQNDVQDYIAITKRVSKRLQYDFDRCAQNQPDVSAQKTASSVVKAFSQQKGKQSFGVTGWHHVWLEKLLQHGILTYQQQVAVYQLWLSVLLVSRKRLLLTEQFADDKTLVINSQTYGPRVQEAPDVIAEALSADEASKSSKCEKLLVGDNVNLLASQAGGASPELTSPYSSEDEADREKTGYDVSWMASFWSFFSSPEKISPKKSGAEEKIACNATPVPVQKEAPTLSPWDGIKNLARTVQHALGGASPDNSFNVPSGSSPFPQQYGWDGDFALPGGTNFASSLPAQALLGNIHHMPSTAEMMERSPLSGELSPQAALEAVNVGDDDLLLAGSILGSPVRFFDGTEFAQLNPDASSSFNAAVTDWRESVAAAQYWSPGSNIDGMSPDSALSNSGGSYTREGSPSYDEIDELFVEFPEAEQDMHPALWTDGQPSPAACVSEEDSGSLDDIDRMLKPVAIDFLAHDESYENVDNGDTDHGVLSYASNGDCVEYPSSKVVEHRQGWQQDSPSYQAWLQGFPDVDGDEIAVGQQSTVRLPAAHETFRIV